MSYINFNKWLILKENNIFGFKDLFGFKNNAPPAPTDDNPIKRLNTELLIEYMLKLKINDSNPFSKYPDQIQWGESSGAIRMVISPLGSFKSIIRRMQTDLEGNTVWLCKKVIPYHDIIEANVNEEEELSNFLFEKIEEIKEAKFESCVRDYKNLRNLVVKIAKKSQQQDILPNSMFFKAIREVNHNNFLIYFEAKGHGAEAPDSQRLEEFIIDMSYNEKKGTIRSIGYNVQSPMRQHSWTIQTPEWDEIFNPSQSEEEITAAITSAFRTY